MKKVQKIAEVLFRDRIILTCLNMRAKKNRVNLHWAPLMEVKFGGLILKKKTKYQNLGDWLAIPIFEHMLQRNNISKDQRVSCTKHLYMIGSLVVMGHQDATIWGSGILKAEPAGYIWKRNKYRKLDVRCVRGPETKRRLEENGYDVKDCLIGDPGVLMPLIYMPKSGAKRPYSVILHMSIKEDVNNSINILTDDWRKTIDEIANSELVISSSLHGIILAEAYGVPAILLNKTQGDDLFKYNDYYYSTGRFAYPIAQSVEEALRMPKPEVPDLTGLQDNLLKTFPTDLWK